PSTPSSGPRGNFQLSTPSGVVHIFSGTKEDARKLLNMGFYFTFGGVITFVRDYDEIVRYIPADRIMSETDAPYVTPTPYRGKRNEPAYVVEVVKKLAELKGVSVEEMKERIWENARRVFRNLA
ncbi:MAG: TatD family hydrolase, partial [Nanoarchaeota archaeon]|nr:TatD family hydrolase [Nanoarchaeota archaeon]